MEIAAQCRESALAWANEIDTRLQAADELERLERVNAELVEALTDLEAMAERYRQPGYSIPDAQKKARAALTTATKEQP